MDAYELGAKIKGRLEIINVVQKFIDDKITKTKDIDLLLELLTLIRIEIDKNSKLLGD